MEAKIIFGPLAEKQHSFSYVLKNKSNWCWNFMSNYSNDANYYLKHDTGDIKDAKTLNKAIKANCRDLYKYLCNLSLSQKKVLSAYGKNCNKFNIAKDIPTLIYDSQFWLIVDNPYFKRRGRSGSSGKWMLYCNKKFLTHSYNALQTELVQILSNNEEEEEKKKDGKQRSKQKKNKNDMMLTELDYYWLKVKKLVTTNHLGMAAKVSTNTNKANQNKSDGVIIVYCHDSDNTQHVLSIAHSIRTLVGFAAEEIRYKTDQATIRGKYGSQSHTYKHTMSKFNELQKL
eukprot:679419_1